MARSTERPTVVDLTRTSVFLDFDGTVTTCDSGIHLLERLAPPSWRDIDAEYVAGVLGSRACLLDEWDLLPKDEVCLRAVAREVPVDPDAPHWCTGCGPRERR